MSVFLQLDRLTKTFGAFKAVDDVDLAVGRGEFFSLLGPSGCGKTTLLRLIGGFEFPTQGEIFLEGARITDDPPNKRPTNMVFQSYAIFPHLNVRDNVGYGLRKLGLGRVEFYRRIDDALGMVRLDGLAFRRSEELSGGQRQRVALARALVRRPKMLLLDEPLGALDKRLREAMQTELRELQRRVGITFVFVTHDQDEALSMSDRVAVMSKGRILQVDSPRELYERPNCREVAAFIGTINLFEAKAVARNQGVTLLDTGALGTISSMNVPAGEKLSVAIRPEKFEIDHKAGRIEGTVGSITYLGERSHIAIHIAGLVQPVFVALQNRMNAVGPSPGTTVFLSWHDEAVIVLPHH